MDHSLKISRSYYTIEIDPAERLPSFLTPYCTRKSFQLTVEDGRDIRQLVAKKIEDACYHVLATAFYESFIYNPKRSDREKAEDMKTFLSFYSFPHRPEDNTIGRVMEYALKGRFSSIYKVSNCSKIDILENLTILEETRKKCEGCFYDEPGQAAHMGPGGCLYDEEAEI